MADVLDRIFDSAAEARVAAQAEGWERTATWNILVRDDQAIELAQDKRSRAWCFGEIR